MHVSQYKHYLSFLVWVFFFCCCFLFFSVQGEHSVYLKLDYFILFYLDVSTAHL